MTDRKIEFMFVLFHTLNGMCLGLALAQFIQ